MHEYVGTVVETGSMVKDVKVGELVTGEGHITCGVCRNCLEGHKENCMGGKVWWREISRTGEYLIQQNLISQHYRLLNGQDQKLISSFDLKEVTEYLEGITNI